MPQGQAAVTWSDGKDVELFLTVLAVQKITIDYKAVAAAFGPNVPASCIQSRMKILRKKAADMGVTPQAQESPAKTPKKRARPATGGPSPKKAKGKNGGKSTMTNNNDDGDDDDIDDDNNIDGLKHEDDDDADHPSTQAPLSHPATPSLSPDENATNGATTAHQTPEAKTNTNTTKRKIAKPRAPRAPRRKSVKPVIEKEEEEEPSPSAEIIASASATEGEEQEGPVQPKLIKIEDVDVDEDDDENDAVEMGAGIPMFKGEV